MVQPVNSRRYYELFAQSYSIRGDSRLSARDMKFNVPAELELAINELVLSFNHSEPSKRST